MKYSELKELFELFDGDRKDIAKAIDSIKAGYIELSELIDGDYILSEYYFSSNDYVFTYHGDVVNINDAFFCLGMEEWFYSEEGVTVYEGRETNYYSRTWAQRDSELHYIDGEYYDAAALDRHGYVWAEDLDEWRYQDDCYYHEDDGWYSYPDDREEYVRGYHNGGYREILFGGRSTYKIGFEIEKEDAEVLQSLDIDEFECQTNYQWRKERDGSLDDDSGYELISPAFEFNVKKIFDYIEGNDVLVKHINADYTTRCGGHINLSKKGLCGHELFDNIKGYTPLFYALYHGRVNKNYCKGKKNDDLKGENEKYQAIKIHDNRIEFRIISAVPNINTLKWRCKLLMMILRNPTDDVIKAYYNVDTKFTKLLSQVYSPERLTMLKERFKTYTQQFENLNID